jgi:hypothetical protein
MIGMTCDLPATEGTGDVCNLFVARVSLCDIFENETRDREK